jgi:uncharacterized protein YodC (DUF2158 family)
MLPGRAAPKHAIHAVHRERTRRADAHDLALYDIASLTMQLSEKINMPEQQFKPGDVVSLRSGGPRMTVAAIDGQSALCEWFSDDQQPRSRSFALTSLKVDDRQ